MPLSRFLRWAMLISMILVIGMSLSLATGVGAGFITLIRGDWLILIGGLVFLFALLSLGSASALEWGRLPRLMLSGLVASLISFTGCLIIILYGFRLSPDVNEFLSKFTATTSLWSLWCGLTGGLVKRKSLARSNIILRRITISLAGIWALFLDGMIWLERFQLPVVDDPLFVIMTALFVLTLMGVTTSKLLLGMQQTAGNLDDPALVKRLVFDAICPRCAGEQSLVTDGDRCSECGLEIKVIVP